MRNIHEKFKKYCDQINRSPKIPLIQSDRSCASGNNDLS